MKGHTDLVRDLSAYLGTRATNHAPDGLLNDALARIGPDQAAPWLAGSGPVRSPRDRRSGWPG